MDGTLVQYPIAPFNSSWDALSLAFSEDKRERWLETRDFYLRRGGDYNDLFAAQLNLLKGTPISDVNKNLFPIPYSNGVVPFFASLNGTCLTGILSAGINIVAEKIVEELGFDFQFSNYLEVAEGKFTGKGEMPVVLGRKKELFYEIMEEYGLKPEDTTFVGDGFGDIPILEVVGIPVVYGRKFDEVTKKAKYIINDFRELNDISKEEK